MRNIRQHFLGNCALLKIAVRLLVFLVSLIASSHLVAAPEAAMMQETKTRDDAIELGLDTFRAQMNALKDIDLCNRDAVVKHFAVHQIRTDSTRFQEVGNINVLGLEMVHVGKSEKRTHCGIAFIRSSTNEKEVQKIWPTIEAVGRHFPLCQLQSNQIPLHGASERTVFRWCQDVHVDAVVIFTFLSKRLGDISIRRDNDK